MLTLFWGHTHAITFAGDEPKSGFRVTLEKVVNWGSGEYLLLAQFATNEDFVAVSDPFMTLASENAATIELLTMNGEILSVASLGESHPDTGVGVHPSYLNRDHRVGRCFRWKLQSVLSDEQLAKAKIDQSQYGVRLAIGPEYFASGRIRGGATRLRSPILPVSFHDREKLKKMDRPESTDQPANSDQVKVQLNLPETQFAVGQVIRGELTIENTGDGRLCLNPFFNTNEFTAARRAISVNGDDIWHTYKDDLRVVPRLSQLNYIPHGALWTTVVYFPVPRYPEVRPAVEQLRPATYDLRVTLHKQFFYRGKSIDDDFSAFLRNGLGDEIAISIVQNVVIK